MEKLQEPVAAEAFESRDVSGEEASARAGVEKKQFVEPALSRPTDVLEDTKFFFQASGIAP